MYFVLNSGNLNDAGIAQKRLSICAIPLMYRFEISTGTG